MSRRLLIPLLIGVGFALMPGAAGAQWYGLNPTVATTECTPSLVEGQVYSETCPIKVEDESPSVEPALIATAPTGTVAVNGPTVCTLAPTGVVTSTCDYKTTVVWGTTFPLEIIYSGDETHQSTSSYFLEWGPGYPNYPPEVPARGPTPAEVSAAQGSSAATSGPRIVSQPQKRTRRHRAYFRFAGGGHYECALDHGSFLPSGASFSRRVSTGPHVLRLRVKHGSTATAFRWRVLPRRG